MDRRGFLKLAGAAASAVGVRGCHSGSDNTEPRQPTPVPQRHKDKITMVLRDSPCYGTSESILGNEEGLRREAYDRYLELRCREMAKGDPLWRPAEPTDRG